MSIDYALLRIEGIYQQDKAGHLMMRIKVPAGVLSTEQAVKICELADDYTSGILHLTTRGSIELHGLVYENLAIVLRGLSAVGLSTRGACGGAVRGISCSTTFGNAFPSVQVLARKLNRHFAGNPHFENLPKKFKIGVDAGYDGARHLIQDIGLVHVGRQDGKDLYDVWAAGGLGRDPIEGFLLEERLPEGRLIPLIEAAVRVHKKHTPMGRRLKHLVREIGREKFRELLHQYYPESSILEMNDGFEKRLTARPPEGFSLPVQASIFAGEVPTGILRKLAAIAAAFAGGYLAVTVNQNLAFLMDVPEEKQSAQQALAEAGFSGATVEEQVTFRVCPGSHECRLGLAPTRDVAREIIAALGARGVALSWAISGCRNSCSQPQLADRGIITVKMIKGEDGSRYPLFDYYRREGSGFGRAVKEGLTREELINLVRQEG
jgi:sulfite reductase beta subunit-like hemoprotein